MNDLKANIEAVAAEQGKPVLAVITDLQVGARATGNDELLDQLCELKWDYI